MRSLITIDQASFKAQGEISDGFLGFCLPSFFKANDAFLLNDELKIIFLKLFYLRNLDYFCHLDR